MEEDNIKFERTLRTQSGSVIVAIPKELLSFLEVDSSDDIVMIGDKGAYGKYIAFWKK